VGVYVCTVFLKKTTFYERKQEMVGTYFGNLPLINDIAQSGTWPHKQANSSAI
jgi:hypothetical protein